MGYPAEWEADVVLADGGTVHVRPVVPEDGDRVVAFHNRQSAESIYFRFFSARPQLSTRDVDDMTNVDYADRMAFVALLGDELVGIARYDRRTGSDQAEVAFFVDDEHNGRGVATVLLEFLAARGRQVGLCGFVAQILPNNRRMLSVTRQAGFEVSSRFADGVVEVILDLAPTPETLEAIEERARRSEARSVARLLEPGSIAVVGAGRERGGIGHELFRHLVDREFGGPVYPVNPAAAQVASVRAYPSVIDVPDEIDVAVIAVPAAEVLGVVEECGRKRVGGLVVVSAGFAECDEEGAALEHELVRSAHSHGMRIIGPNSMGVVNTAPDVRAHMTFIPMTPEPGRVALSSQSGIVGEAVLQRATALGIGISTFVSLGNKADVSTNDLLRYWEQDDRTDLVLLYVESFGNPRTFSRVARRIARRKPIVAVRSSREAGVDAVLRQIGLIRVDTLDELLDIARILATQPVPAGGRTAVVGNSVGMANLATDSLEAAGLTVTARDDLPYDADPAAYQAAVGKALAGDADLALVLYAPPLRPGADEVARAVEAAVAAGAEPKPVVLSVVADARPTILAHPNFQFPDTAAHALGRIVAYGRWRAEPEGELVRPEGVDADAARAAVAGASEGRLGIAATVDLLRAAGIDVVPQALGSDEDEVVAAAATVGYPVAMKATGLARLAKTEAGGLALDLYDEDGLRQSYRRMRFALGDAMVPAVVQAMAAPGDDVQVRVRRDPLVGAVIGVGRGGAGVPEPDPAAARILPLTDLDAQRLAATVVPTDGQPTAALTDLLLRLSALVDDVPELATIDLNPVIVSDDRAAVTDAAVDLAPWHPDPMSTLRRL